MRTRNLTIFNSHKDLKMLSVATKKMENSDHIREALQQFKIKSGLNWKQIAENAGLSQSTVTRFASGTTDGAGPSYETIQKLMDCHGGLREMVTGQIELTKIPIYGYLNTQPRYVVFSPQPGQDRYVSVGAAAAHSPDTYVIRASGVGRMGFLNWNLFFKASRKVDFHNFPQFEETNTSILGMISTTAGQSFCGHVRRVANNLQMYGLSSVTLQMMLEKSKDLPDGNSSMQVDLEDIAAVYTVYGMVAVGEGELNIPMLKEDADQTSTAA